MKNFLILLASVLLPYGPAAAATDYYLKIDGIDGETTAAPAPEREAPTRAPVPTLEATVTATPQEASTDAFIKFDGVDGETKGGNVEFEWKVEEGESAPPAAEGRDVASGAQPLTPDFSILLGGGSDDEDAQEARDEAAEILHQGMQEGDMPTESVSMNFEKIKAKVRQDVKLFGFIPVSASVTVEVDAEERVTVRFPWWSFLASGKDDALGERVFTALSNVLKTKHDTLKNAIGNIR